MNSYFVGIPPMMPMGAAPMVPPVTVLVPPQVQPLEIEEKNTDPEKNEKARKGDGDDDEDKVEENGTVNDEPKKTKKRKVCV